VGITHLSDLDVVMIPALFGILSGMWAAFALGYSQSPAGTYQSMPKWWSNPRLLGFTLRGAAIALIVDLVFAAIFGGMSVWTFIAALIALVVAVFWCHHSALTGFTFKNEGQVQEEWGDSDYKLPYLGDRYCLQGAHGYWSHFSIEEGAYDWSIPDRTEVLSAKKGHIIAYYDQKKYQYYLPLQHPEDDVHLTTGEIPYQEDVSQPMAGANYVAVRHENGSVAFDSWLMTNGVTGEDWSPRLRNELGTGRDGQRAVGRGGFNGIFVQEGTVLGGSGWTDSNHPTTDETFPNAPAWWSVVVGALVLAAGIMFVMILGFVYSGLIPATIGVGTDQATNSYCPPLNGFPPPIFWTSTVGPPQGCRDPKFPTIFNANEGFDGQYCEYLQTGPIKQPWATWSAPLGFGPFGLAFLLIYAVGGPNGKPFRNRMTATWWYPLTLGLVIIINGPGSMIFHTTFNGFWSELDPCGMCLFTAFVAAYNITRIANRLRAGSG
jgi:hypothetical protein